MRVIGYGRCSTGGQDASLDVQHRSVMAEAERRGWTVTWLSDKGISGASANRPSLRAALALLEAGEADALVSTKVDRLSRSTEDFADLLATAQRQGWNVVVLDLGMDLSTPMGRAMSQMAAVFAELERNLIGAAHARSASCQTDSRCCAWSTGHHSYRRCGACPP